MNLEQRRSYTEILEILRVMKLIYIIPDEVVQKMETEKDNDWNFKYNETVALENQNMLYSTKVLFSYIYINYIATEEKRKELESIYEKNKSIKYNSDDLFKNRVNKINQEVSENHNIQSISTEISTVVIEKKWYQKLFDKIKNIFIRS